MKKYQIIYADPPWDMVRSFGGANWRNGERQKPVLDYPTMSIDEIKRLPIQDISTSSTALYLWTTQRYLEDSFAVIRAWGFKPVCTLVWCKSEGGFVGGAYYSNVEFLQYAKRKDSRIKGKLNSQWFAAERSRHSQKPQLFCDLIEQIHDPPYIELFARRRRLGWDCWGNEVESDIQLDIPTPKPEQSTLPKLLLPDKDGLIYD